MAIGSLLAWALVIRKRNMQELMAWTPNGRILTEIQKDSLLTLPDNFYCLLNCQGFTSLDWDNLKQDGNVDFGSSLTHEDPKRYIINYQKEDAQLTVEVLFFADHYVVDSVYSSASDAKCDCP